jgi:hypothetical protein
MLFSPQCNGRFRNIEHAYAYPAQNMQNIGTSFSKGLSKKLKLTHLFKRHFFMILGTSTSNR